MKKRRKLMQIHKREKQGLEREGLDLKRKLQDVENNQKVQGIRKPEKTGMGSQENRDRGAAQGGTHRDVEQGTGQQAAGTSGVADVLMQLKQALHDIGQNPAAQPVNGSQQICATSLQSVAAFQPPPRPFVVPHYISATCLQSVAAFQPPIQPFVTPQKPF